MEIDQFKLGMRRLASGVSLITTVADGTRHGLVATSVTSVSTDPPSLLVCVNRNASAHDHIAQAGILCVNLLAETDQTTAARFSSSIDREKRFEKGDWQLLETGAPALATALASFDCRIERTVSHGSHTIFICKVAKTHVWEVELSPLVYLDGRYRNIVLETTFAAAS